MNCDGKADWGVGERGGGGGVRGGVAGCGGGEREAAGRRGEGGGTRACLRLASLPCAKIACSEYLG